MEEVESIHVDDFNTRDVSKSLGELRVLVEVDNEGTLAYLVSPVTELTLSSPDGSGLSYLVYILKGSEPLEEGNGITCLLIGFESILYDEGNLWNM